MAFGSVKRMSDKGDYGFIKVEGGGQDVYVHISSIRRSGIDTPLKEGDRISFDVEQGDRGPRAVNIARA